MPADTLAVPTQLDRSECTSRASQIQIRDFGGASRCPWGTLWQLLQQPEAFHLGGAALRPKKPPSEARSQL